MRNLKRALSLALASVMLLGMMVVGSSAAFADADEIVNKEAVEITAGLGLFAGSDGKFDPKGTVTRAQMAAVIAKMFYGSDLNADTYKGGNQFSDTAAFEGGWAEGYVNLGVEKGWFKGYGDGTFGPGNAVTTAEAVTMLINLLGVDAGEGTWPMTVMAAAEDIDLFDLKSELKPAPATGAALTRDQLAVMVWNALNYSAEGVLGYEIPGINIEFKTLADAIAYAQAELIPLASINEVSGDTLAKEVFEVKEFKGYISANQATGEKSTWIDADMDNAGDEDFNIETGLDQLNHYVTIYYSEAYETEKKPGTAYAVVEMAEYVVVEKAITKKADYMAAFGSKVEDVYGVPNYDKDLFTADPGTYVISNDELNNEGKIIAFIPETPAYVGEITAVSEVAGKEYIKIGTKRYENNEDEDVIVAYDGIAEDDIVVYKQIADSEGNTMTFVFKPETVSGKITNTKDAPLSGEYNDRIWVDGTEYEMSAVDGSALLDVYADVDLTSNATYDVYLYEGKVIGFEAIAGNANIDEVIYVTNGYEDDVKGSYGSTGTKTHYYVQGVNAKGEEVNILVGIEDCADDAVNYPVIDDFEGTYGYNAFYTFEKSEDKDQSKKDIMLPTPVTAIDAFDPDEHDYFAAAVDYVNADEDAFTKDSKYVTVLTDCGECAECTADPVEECTDPVRNRMYLTAETKYFIVDDTNGIDDLKVSTYTGAIAKDISAAGTLVDVIATEDENENRYAELVVIYAESGLAAEDYIFVSDIAYADASKVEDGWEVLAFFSETGEFKTIIADERAQGFYNSWTVNEDGIYEMDAFTSDPGVYEDQLLEGVVGSAIITDGGLDLADAANVKIFDLRDPEVIEDSEVAEIATLKDLQAILGDKKHVYFDAIVDVEDPTEPVVTYIFVYSVEYALYECDGETLVGWVEDDGTTYAETCSEVDADTDDVCDICGKDIEP